MATKHAGLTYALTHELPRTMELLREGKISEYKASIIEAETHDLTGSDKARIDAAIANEAPELGPRTWTVRVRHMSETTDPHTTATTRTTTSNTGATTEATVGRGSGAPVFVRRVFTHPISGKLVGMESTRRNYPELLRQLVTYREGGGVPHRRMRRIDSTHRPRHHRT